MENLNHLTPPSMESSLSHGWTTTKRYFLPLLLAVIILAVVGLPTNLGLKDIQNFQRDTVTFLLRGLYLLLIVPVFSFSADLMFLVAVRDRKLDFGNLFAGFKKFVNVVLANLLSTCVDRIGFLLLIIPGIWISCRLAFVLIW